MGMVQDLERAHIEAEMKRFKECNIQQIPAGKSNYHNSREHKNYIASTKRGAKIARQLRSTAS